MTEDVRKFIYLPGASGGGEEDLAAFASGLDYPISFDLIGYPGWQRYVEDGFSAEALIEEITAEIVKKAPAGPIRLMGLSIGGHFGYAAALRLRDMGREIAVFCAIDSFQVVSAQPSSGWQIRALQEVLYLLKKGRFKDLARLVRSKVWRGLLRLAGARLAGVLRRISAGGKVPSAFSGDGVAEKELSMRLLLREVAPWAGQLDRDPIALPAPTILLRTQTSASFDEAWKRRCPNIAICEVPGKHLTLFEPENITGLRDGFVTAARRLAV